MLSILSGYARPVFEACVLFPFAAAIFTIPFMISNYRRYGGIAIMRVLVVYSFILYSMCAFLLTVLPLPSFEMVQKMSPKAIGWIPLQDLVTALQKAGIQIVKPDTWLNPAHWKLFLKSKGFFQIIANIVMQIPLGFYLRYYFRCNLKKTVLIGFCVSLFYELTQLSGLFFIYPKAYRFCSVDDLINNTLGAAIGYGITPVLALLLPSRDDIDRISYRKGEQLTLIRRGFAMILDFILVACIEIGICFLFKVRIYTVTVATFLIYYVLFPGLDGGWTFGQKLLKIRVADAETLNRPGIRQLLVRNLFLYLAEPLLFCAAVFMLLLIVVILTSEGLDTIVFLFCMLGCGTILLGVTWFFLYSQMKWNTFPHGHFSRTVIVKTEK